MWTEWHSLFVTTTGMFLKKNFYIICMISYLNCIYFTALPIYTNAQLSILVEKKSKYLAEWRYIVLGVLIVVPFDVFFHQVKLL